MDWWSELWLNEGFATWVGWYAIDHFYPGKYFVHNEDKAVFGVLINLQNGTFGASLSYVVHLEACIITRSFTH